MKLIHVLHQEATTYWRDRRDEQVHMIGHQAVRMERAAKTAKATAQVEKIKAPVPISHEARRAVIPALDDVHR